MQNNEVQPILNLNNLISETYNDYNINNTNDYAKSLINILKKYNIWPLLQVKKFKGVKNLVLLHNTYIRDDIPDNKALYEQCRSVILDFEAPDKNKNIVVSYSNSIPQRMNACEYDYNDTDEFYEAYDGTTITCYYYDNTWHIGTTSCPDINSSWFSHPTKTHGAMFDEVLYNKFECKISLEGVREYFTNMLDKDKTYMFVLLHYDNIHYIDYTTQIGENYMELMHVSTKNMYNYEEINIQDQPLSNLGLKYPKVFKDNNDAYNYLVNINPSSYGYIIKRKVENEYKLAKISSDKIAYRENTDPCYPNPWLNLLATYMKNRVDYHINDYIRDYNPNIEKLYDNNGKEIDPTYLIHTTISTIKDIIYKLYVATTTYNSKKNIFKMNKELDSQLVPILRFHLGKLRKRQITIYSKMITSRDVYYYLCHCLRPNDIKQLIHLISTTSGYDITERSTMCLVTMNKLLN